MCVTVTTVGYGYITCIGECVHGGAPRVPTPDPLLLVGCANETEPSVLAYHETLHPFFAFYGPGSKVTPFAMGVRS